MATGDDLDDDPAILDALDGLIASRAPARCSWPSFVAGAGQPCFGSQMVASRTSLSIVLLHGAAKFVSRN